MIGRIGAAQTSFPQQRQKCFKNELLSKITTYAAPIVESPDSAEAEMEVYKNLKASYVSLTGYLVKTQESEYDKLTVAYEDFLQRLKDFRDAISVQSKDPVLVRHRQEAGKLLAYLGGTADGQPKLPELQAYISQQKSILLGYSSTLDSSILTGQYRGIIYTYWSSYDRPTFKRESWPSAFDSRVNYVLRESGSIEFIFPSHDGNYSDSIEKLKTAKTVWEELADRGEPILDKFMEEFRLKYYRDKGASESEATDDKLRKQEVPGELTIFELCYLVERDVPFELYFKNDDERKAFEKGVLGEKLGKKIRVHVK